MNGHSNQLDMFHPGAIPGTVRISADITARKHGGNAESVAEESSDEKDSELVDTPKPQE